MAGHSGGHPPTPFKGGLLKRKTYYVKRPLNRG
jgi:hypothetical protein